MHWPWFGFLLLIVVLDLVGRGAAPEKAVRRLPEHRAAVRGLLRVLVYGDPSERIKLDAVVELARGMDTRNALVTCGQVEQALADEASPLQPDAERLTDRLAEAFVSGSLPNFETGRLTRSKELEVELRSPEGFSFYALYPDQYVLAAQRWAAGREKGEVLAVGIRSIGTTLSAVVAAELRRQGWPASRLTVRPTGHPFSRETRLDIERLPAEAIVVDEGPGLSGSSMASVAEALVRFGLSPNRIAFLPGHANEPGPEATDEVRRCWQIIGRVNVDPAELRFDGLTEAETLMQTTEEAMGVHAVRIEDLGNGRWREAAVVNAPCYALFERPKLRVFLEDGSSVLWTFYGLGMDADHAGASLESKGFEPVGAALGYLGRRWIEGTALNRSQAPILQVMGHVMDHAGEPLPEPELVASFARLAEMLRCNAAEALGGEATEGVERLIKIAEGALNEQWLSAGDGRLSPEHWIRTPDGELVKLPSPSPHRDHTLVGWQPVLWDYAGAAVECGVAMRGGPEQDFYAAAYAAFRMGMASMCLACAPEGERDRLQGAFAFYRDKLAAVFSEATSPTSSRRSG